MKTTDIARTLCLTLIAAVAVLVPGQVWATTADGMVVGTTKILDNGSAADRFNIVLVGDGYQQAELAQFAQDAQDFVEFLLDTPPFNAGCARSALNVYRIDVTSTDSGADDPTSADPTHCVGATGATAATYFDSTFCGDGVNQRLLTTNTATVTDVLNANLPEWDLSLVIVNSSVYGGSGGSKIGTTSTNGTWENIAIHEFGHSAFGLADEYEYFQGCGSGETDRDNHPAAEPVEPNVTIETDSTLVKWRDQFTPMTPIPTTQNATCSVCDPQGNPAPGMTIVGLYEGAHYFHCDAYRPTFDCMMRNFGLFCPVCTRQILTVLEPYFADGCGVADVAVTKSALPDPVSPGEQLTYEIVVTNNGTDLAPDVTVIDTLPAEVSYVSDTDSCAEGPPGTLTCHVGDLAIGATTSFMVVVEVDPNLVAPTCAPFAITNTAQVSSLLEDPDLSNNEATADTAIVFPLDHFLCYEVALQPFEVVPGVTLNDAFGSGTVVVSNLKRLCTPTDKNGEDPSAALAPCHLTAYEIDQNPAPAVRRNVTINNQFGPATIDVGRPERLLVPTAKGLVPPPALVDPTIDHFKCHRVRGARTRVPGLTFTDQIDFRTGAVVRPLRLCSPADKRGEGIIDPSVHLMCYEVRTRPRRPSFKGPFYIDNQFDTFPIHLTGTRELCVPTTVTGGLP